MKIWKKTLAMLMCCGFVFSTAACTDDNGGSSGSGNGGDAQVLEEKKTYLSDIGSALVGAKSFKVELDASISQSDDNSEMDMTIEGDIELSQNADDEELYDMSLVLNVSGTSKYDYNDDGDFKDIAPWEDEDAEDPDMETQEVEEAIKLYVKDGYVYMCQENEDGDEEWRKYYKPYDEVLADEMGETLPDDVTNAYLEMFEKVLDNELVTGTVDAVKTGIAKTAEIKDGMFVIAFDAKTLVNDTIAMLVDDPTMEELVNYALAMVDEELTVEGILDKLATYGDKTILDVYDEIDAWLVANYEKGVQDIVELVTKDQDIIDALEEVGLEDALIEQFQNFNVEETLTSMLEAYNMKDLTIDEIIAMMMGGMGGQAAPMASEEAPEMTLESIVEMVKEQYLDMTLSEMVGEDWEDGVAVLEKVKANALSASFGTKYGNDKKVNYIEMKMNFDVDAASTNTNSLYDSETGEYVYETIIEEMSVAESFTIKISEISTSLVEIKLPEAAKNAEVWYDSCDYCDDDSAEHDVIIDSKGEAWTVCDDCQTERSCANCGKFLSYNDEYSWIGNARFCVDCYENNN